ncbi:hypothetical protein MANES_15G188901v8 [Manihot esculenta]|uniref:Uncharacterized protein n=1 Tax=Manihot esculenta TaxID=3983 RepID=A0ACB7GH68_MANES|nr:hypothetical protein MANES_15G188901v8 [Manihot esculenta]
MKESFIYDEHIQISGKFYQGPQNFFHFAFVSLCRVIHFAGWAFRGSQEPAVNKLKEPILDEITAALVSRFELNFTRQDTASMWFLCKQEIKPVVFSVLLRSIRYNLFVILLIFLLIYA